MALIPKTTTNGAFGGKPLAWLNAQFNKSIAEPTAPLNRHVMCTANGAIGGRAAQWLATNYGNGTAPALDGVADRLVALDDSGNFTGRTRAWLIANLTGSSTIPGNPSLVYVPPASFTQTFDPVEYLAEGQKWETIADIRPAFQRALDDAHAHAFASSNNVAKVVIPSGRGKLTSSTTNTVINYASTAASAANRNLPKTMGFGLRPNMPGRIVFMGNGSVDNPDKNTKASIIQLSSKAHCFFYADTNEGTSSGTPAGYTWVRQSAYPVEDYPGNTGMRPSSLMCFQNYDFVGFTIDNKDATAGATGNVVSLAHLVFGCTPTANWRQPYMSFDKLNHADIRAVNFDPNPDAVAAQKSSQLIFGYRTKHTRHHEPTNGEGVNVWGGWDLKTLAGRQAAFNAKWTFMNRMNFYDIHAINCTRAIHVTSDRALDDPNDGTPSRNSMAMYFDEINLYRCTHTQPEPYTYQGIQTSFFLGAGGMGGISRAVDCYSENVGDNPIEMGAFDTRYIKNFTSKNARLPGILFTNTQSPPHPETATCIVDKFTFEVDAAAIATKPRARGFEFDLEGDAKEVPFNNVVIKDATMIIDGGATKQNIGLLVRAYRYGWVFDGAIKQLDINGLTLNIKNITTPVVGSGTDLDKIVPLVWYKPNDFDTATAICSMKNVQINMENWERGPTLKDDNDKIISDAWPFNAVGVLPITSGSFTLDGLTISVNNVAGVPSMDAVAIGAQHTEWARVNSSGNTTRREFFIAPSPGGYTVKKNGIETNYPAFPARTTGENVNYEVSNGKYTVKKVTASYVSGKAVPATRRGIVLQGQNPIDSLAVSGAKPDTTWSAQPVTTTSLDIKPNGDGTGSFTYAKMSEHPVPVRLYYWNGRNEKKNISPNPNLGKITIT